MLNSHERYWIRIPSQFFEIQKNSDIEFFESNQFVRNVWNLESVWSRNFCYATTLSRLCLFNKSQGHYVFVVTYLDDWIELGQNFKQKYRVSNEILLLSILQKRVPFLNMNLIIWHFKTFLWCLESEIPNFLLRQKIWPR